ncbi:MAG: BTAD domain-containing putative transcriptional regulator [Chloroflexota bacterium]
MARLSISLFGSMQVLLDNIPVSGFASKKAQALLAYLAVEKRPHNRDELAALFWPDYINTSARTNLRSSLANVRRVLCDHDASPPFFHVSRQTIAFNRASDIMLDIADFEGLSSSEAIGPELVPQLQTAVSNAQGTFLAGFSIADSPAFEEWLLLQREYFGRQLSLALRHLTHHYTKEKEYGTALANARQWVTLDPWQEEAHREVMSLLTLNGQRNEALVHYANCRRTLLEEVGVEPSDETTQLFEEIRNGNLNDASAEVRVDPVKHTIPQPLTPLIGRNVVLNEVGALLTTAHVRLLTIIGPGGIGKTHLALEAALAQQSHFIHGMALVSLAPLISADSIVSTIAEALNFSFYQKVTPEEQILDYLRQKQLLLVMDNYEHLVEDTRLVTKLLAGAPDLKILATSRVRLQIRGEQLYPLAGLDYPNEKRWSPLLVGENSQDQQALFSALALFVQQAQQQQPDFALTSENIGDVIRICQLVHGMPLGIILAAAWITLLTPHEIAAEIARSFNFLRADSHGLPVRHQSLQAVFSHTWSLLSEREQMIFQQMSVFRGGFTQDAVQAVTGAMLSDLLVLVNKFLIHRVPDGRYMIHELVRQFAAQKLTESSVDEMMAQQRHCAFFSTFLSQRRNDIRGQRQQDAIIEIEVDSENVRIAWQWAAEHGEIEHLDRSIDTLALFYEWRGRYQDGLTACRMAVEHLSGLNDGEAIRVQIRLLIWQASFNRLLGHRARSSNLTRKSLNLLNSSALVEQDLWREKAATYLELGRQAEHITVIREWLERSLAIYRARNDTWGTAQALHILGIQIGHKSTYDKTGRKSAYQYNPDFLEESLQLRRTLGDQRGIAEVLMSQGFIAILRSQAAEGEILLKQSLSISKEMGDRLLLSGSLSRQGIGYWFSGRFEEAYALISEELEIWQELGNREMFALATSTHSVIVANLGRFSQARSKAESALELVKEFSDLWGISWALWHLGFAILGEGASNEAEQLLAESIAMHKEIGWRGREHEVLTTLGFAKVKSGEVDQAQRVLTPVLAMALENRFQRTAIEGICLAAILSAVQNKSERAVELYALAQRYPYIANSRWFADVIGIEIAKAAELLAPEVILAARERGSKRDLWKTVAEHSQGST